MEKSINTIEKDQKFISKLLYNPIMDTDSYKFSHWNQIPENVIYVQGYFEARGGDFTECTLFGMQYLLNEYFSKPVTIDHVDQAEAFAVAHGVPFNREGWMHIVNEYGGYMPVKIRGLREGTVVPVSNALFTVECYDPKCIWIYSWLETMLVRLWYPSTIAIASRESKKILKHYLEISSDDPEGEIAFKLHDFGARGVTCHEQSAIGGAAHLLSFLGSDTVAGIQLANHYYDCDMSGFSIPASEHSTVSMWGRKSEHEMYKNYVQKYLVERIVPPGVPKLAACVSDTYNIFEACKFWCSPEMRNVLKDSGGTLVIRPDSGEPLSTLREVFAILETELGDEITRNKKGYKVLPSYVRVIQGDGIDRKSMFRILDHLIHDLEWSASNIAFGSGGGLLQNVNRDTQKFAFKCCAAVIDGVEVEIRKDPITDQGKRSKAGRLDLIKNHEGNYETIKLENGVNEHPNSEFVVIYDHGKMEYHTTLSECRERMKI